MRRPLSDFPSSHSLRQVLSFDTDSDKEDPRQNVVRFSNNGTVLATGGTDGVVRVWRVSTGGKFSEVLLADGLSVVVNDGAPSLMTPCPCRGWL